MTQLTKRRFFFIYFLRKSEKIKELNTARKATMWWCGEDAGGALWKHKTNQCRTRGDPHCKCTRPLETSKHNQTKKGKLAEKGFKIKQEVTRRRTEMQLNSTSHQPGLDGWRFDSQHILSACAHVVSLQVLSFSVPLLQLQGYIPKR